MFKNDIYLIKDLSRITGLSVYTLKYYSNLGLIKEVGRSPETNFRYFDDSTVEAIRKVLAYKKDGVSLNKIAALFKEEKNR